MTQHKSGDDTLKRLGLLLQLGRMARKASEDELHFLIVNETKTLIPYRQAVLFKYQGQKLVPVSVSGLAVFDPSAPFIQWLGRLAALKLKTDNPWVAAPLTPQTLAPDAHGHLAEMWAQWLPREGFWLPLLGPRDNPEGVLAMFRNDPWPEPAQHVLSYLADNYGLSLANYRPPAHKTFLEKFKKRWRILAIILLAISLYPAKENVLVPAEVTANRPQMVRSSLEGVVERLLVAPNQEIKKGQVIARLDDAQLRSRLAVARKVLEMARAEYNQLLQQALNNPEAKARLPLIKGRIDQLAAEAAYVSELLKRTEIVSQSDGVAVFEDPNAWLGRPVSVGEKIMLVADPGEVELTMYLPANESLPLEIGDEALFFPNTTPGSPWGVKLNYISYQAREQSGQTLAFTIRGTFEGEAPPQLGLRGTAKIYGSRRPLILIALRHPLRLARQWLGW